LWVRLPPPAPTRCSFGSRLVASSESFMLSTLPCATPNRPGDPQGSLPSARSASRQLRRPTKRRRPDRGFVPNLRDRNGKQDQEPGSAAAVVEKSTRPTMPVSSSLSGSCSTSSSRISRSTRMRRFSGGSPRGHATGRLSLALRRLQLGTHPHQLFGRFVGGCPAFRGVGLGPQPRRQRQQGVSDSLSGSQF
jgi:hypothetical protein